MTTQPESPAPKATLKIDSKVELLESKMRADHMAAYDWNRILVQSQRLADAETERNMLSSLVAKQMAEITALKAASLTPADPASDPALATAVN